MRFIAVNPEYLHKTTCDETGLVVNELAILKLPVKDTFRCDDVLGYRTSDRPEDM